MASRGLDRSDPHSNHSQQDGEPSHHSNRTRSFQNGLRGHPRPVSSITHTYPQADHLNRHSSNKDLVEIEVDVEVTPEGLVCVALSMHSQENTTHLEVAWGRKSCGNSSTLKECAVRLEDSVEVSVEPETMVSGSTVGEHPGLISHLLLNQLSAHFPHT